MYNTCLRIVNNGADAEDIVQESFIEAFRNLGSYRHETTFGGWLKRICVNRCINFLKKRKVSWEDLEMEDLPGEEPPDSAADLDMSFEVHAVKKGILSLPAGYRTVLGLYLLEGYDHEEIAIITGLAESTIRTQYIRGKQRLLQILKEYQRQSHG